jgi:hypothetical protein
MIRDSTGWTPDKIGVTRTGAEKTARLFSFRACSARWYQERCKKLRDNMILFSTTIRVCISQYFHARFISPFHTELTKFHTEFTFCSHSVHGSFTFSSCFVRTQFMFCSHLVQEISHRVHIRSHQFHGVFAVFCLLFRHIAVFWQEKAILSSS